MKMNCLLISLLLLCASCAETPKTNPPVMVADTTATVEEVQPEAMPTENTPAEPQAVVDTLKTTPPKQEVSAAEKGKAKDKVVANATLEGKWELVTLDDVKADSVQYPRAIPFLIFNEKEGKFSGSSGCNRLGGTLVKSGNKIELSKIISTRMACRESNEPAYMTFLNGVSTFSVKGSKLVLKGSSGEAVYKSLVDSK